MSLLAHWEVSGGLEGGHLKGGHLKMGPRSEMRGVRGLGGPKIIYAEFLHLLSLHLMFEKPALTDTWGITYESV